MGSLETVKAATGATNCSGTAVPTLSLSYNETPTSASSACL